MNGDGLNLDALDGNPRDEAIPNYTLAQYQTTEPYEFLWKIEDRFTQEQVLKKMQLKARSVGFTGFAKLWDVYKRGKRGESMEDASNMTDFPEQPLELSCGRYQCDVHGVTLPDVSGFNVVVCQHPLMPVKRLKNIDTGFEKTEIAYYRRGRWQKLVVDQPTLNIAGRIVELSAQGLNINSENAKDIVKYMATLNSLNDDKLGEEHSVGRLGWIGEKYKHFSPYEDGLRFDGNVAYQSMYKAVRECGSYDKWLEVARHGREMSIVGRLMLDASFASALVDPLGALPFIVHAWGGSGAGKTLGLLLAASVWAEPATGGFIKTFNSTGVGQELTAGFLNSMPFCLDELQVIKDRRDFDQMIYTLTEGAGKTRGAKAGGVQTTVTWANAIITTGEMPITSASSGGGAVNRVINLDCQDQKLFDDGPACANVLKANFGFAGKRFVARLMEEGMIDRAMQMQQGFNKELRDAGATDKQALSASILLAADVLVTEQFFDGFDALTAQDLAPLLVTKQEADVNARCYDWLCGEIATNSIRFNNSVDDNKGAIWGKIDGNVCYFITTTLRKIMTEEGFNYTSFKQWCKRNGKLAITGDGTHDACRVRIGQVNARCLAIKLPEDSEEAVVVDDEKMPFDD